jgi:hypothetical protein
MSARLTVVLDDEELYRKLKVKAAHDGVPMKQLVEDGLRMVLDAAVPQAQAEGREFSWERYEAMLEQFRKEDEALGIAESSYPTDLSDIKHHLYGYPKTADRRALRIAEEKASYDAK